MVGPLPRGGGPLRQRSRSEIRGPGGTSSSWSSTYRWPTVSNPSSTAHRRRVVSSRTWATSRVNVLTPGSSTSRSRSHPTASMKIAFGPSPDVHDRADTHPRRSASTAVNSFQVADPPDLPLMIEPRLAPLGVPLHTRRISDLQLLGYEVQHRQWNIQRILQNGPDPADRHQLEREPELHVLAAMTVDQRPVLVIEKEHPLQVRLRRHPRVPAGSQPPHHQSGTPRHTPQSRTDPPVTNSEPPNRYKIGPSAARATSERPVAVTPPALAR